MGHYKLSLVYFSATGTTRKYVEALRRTIAIPERMAVNIADDISIQLPELEADDVVIIAAPVYGGRIPSIVTDALRRFKGNNTKAIAIVVYGNRDYDDALLELTDIIETNGFHVIGAGAFIARHSIFPKVAEGRPDAADIRQAEDFARMCMEALHSCNERTLHVKGNRPYKNYGGVPIHPAANHALCVNCGECSRKCPTGAIDAESSWLTDDKICISCGRCINVCPHAARRYSGIKYGIIEKMFSAAYSKRKEPEFFI